VPPVAKAASMYAALSRSAAPKKTVTMVSTSESSLLLLLLLRRTACTAVATRPGTGKAVARKAGELWVEAGTAARSGVAPRAMTGHACR
jgi:hypothetical protein